jgi:hypothetical protein
MMLHIFMNTLNRRFGSQAWKNFYSVLYVARGLLSPKEYLLENNLWCKGLALLFPSREKKCCHTIVQLCSKNIEIMAHVVVQLNDHTK